MTTFMEQAAESGGWLGNVRHDTHTPPQTFPGENSSQRLSERQRTAEPQRTRTSTVDSPRARRRELLTSLVEAEILPRLARIRQKPSAAEIAGPAVTTDVDTQALVRLLLAREENDAATFIEDLRLRGVPPASLYLGILTSAARILGELWEEDRCDFSQVTIGLGRLQRVLRGLSPHFQIAAVRRTQSEAVVLVPAPGDQHTLGLLMLAEFFRREGWQVAGGPGTEAGDAAGIVRGSWIDIAGFSIGSAARIEGLAQCIRAVRRASHNPNLFVMVGGPLFLAQPDLATRVGADSAAADAPGAIRQANGLLAMRAATAAD